MSVTTAASELDGAVRDLHAASDELRRTVCEFAPLEGRTMHVDELCAWATDLAGTTGAMRREFHALDGAPPDRLGMEAVATRVGARHLDFEERFAEMTADPVRIGEMRRLALKPGGWPGWSRAAGDAMAACGPALMRLRRALYSSWRELAQHPEIRLDRATVTRLNVIDGGRPAHPAAATEQDV
jgi:hypothetical protein